MTSLSVVIPAYNEEGGIAEILHRILAVRPALAQTGVADLELLVVDDGSRDRTAEIATGIDGVRVVRHRQNRGYGGALKTGFAEARGDLIGFMDADGTYPPEYFPQMCEQALKGCDLVVGSRMAGAQSEMPLTRRIGNVLFATLLSMLSNQRITDSASGMRVFRREILENIYPLPDGLNLTPVMSTRAAHEKMKVAELPIPYSERVGRSKLSVVRDGTVFLQSMIWTVLAYNPVRILGMLGMGGVIVSILLAAPLVVGRLAGVTTLRPWEVAGLFGSFLSAVIGTTLFAVGVMFNYLVSLFYKRPIRQGLFGRPIFAKPLDRHFWWLGLASALVGVVIGIGAVVLSLNGWEIARLWLYLLGSALFILNGLQLVIYWLLVRVLEELSCRELMVQHDRAGGEATA